MRQKLPPQAAALLESFSGLSAEEQLLAYEAITDYLQSGLGARPAVDPELEERAEALRIMRAVVEHIGLTAPEELLIRQFDAAPEKVREGWKSRRVISAWGTWKFARQALSGGRQTETARQRSLRRARGGTRRSRQEYLAGIRAWLATDPPSLTEASYADWAREWNLTLPEGETPYALPFAIRNGLGLKWGATLRVARGEIKIDQARSETREYTPSVSTGEHDLVRRGDLRLIANEPAWKIDNMIRRDDFPVAALIIGQRKFWLREDIEAYLRGDEMPERTENELGDLYVSASQAAEILGLHAHRVSASDVKDLPEPVFKGKNTHLWRRSDIEAFKEVRKRQGLHGGRRRFPKSR